MTLNAACAALNLLTFFKIICIYEGMKLERLLFFIAFMMMLGPSCKEKELCDPTPQFDIDVFVQQVEDALNDPINPVSGYEFVVNKGGNVYHQNAGGMAIYASDDGGPIKMTEYTRMNVASISKFIGTIALMQVLEKHKINTGATIRDYLPTSWQSVMHESHYKANFSTAITFEALLQMNTGIQFGNPSNFSPGPMPTTDDMLRAIGQPADANRKNQYQNGNFTLIRVLITELEYKLDANATDYNYQTAEAYFDYIKRNIFDKLNMTPPMTISAVDNFYSTNTFPRAHQYPFDSTFRDGNSEVGWAATSNAVNSAGSAGLVLSAMDVAKILAYFKHTDDIIISKSARTRMLNLDLGLWGTGSGDYGKYPSKGGTKGPQTSTNRAIMSMMMMFPNGVEAVVITNCYKLDNGSMLREAFDASWFNPCE